MMGSLILKLIIKCINSI